MSEVTLKAIEELMDNMLDKKFDEKLRPIQLTLNSHTKSLETLISERNIKDENKLVSEHRLDRLEEWEKQVGDKVQIQLDL